MTRFQVRSGLAVAADPPKRAVPGAVVCGQGIESPGGHGLDEPPRCRKGGFEFLVVLLVDFVPRAPAPLADGGEPALVAAGRLADLVERPARAGPAQQGLGGGGVQGEGLIVTVTIREDAD